MQDEVNSTVLVVVMTTMAGSLGLLFLLFQKHLGGQPLLAYEPRRRVPWGLWAVALAVFVPTLLTAFMLPDGLAPSEKLDPEDFLYVGWLNSAINIGFVLVATVFLATLLRADAADFGLPENIDGIGRDVGIGVVGCLAAMLPIYLVNLALVNVFESREQHPLVDQIREASSPEIVLVGMIMAVVAAPLYEEFTFRLLLQGWLEKIEDRLLGFRATLREPIEPLAAEEFNEAYSSALDSTNSEAPAAITGIDDVAPADDLPASRPARGMIADLPHGWTPVLVSGVVFGLAHLGHGVAPVPLVLFGIVLGYMYQRTHRLVPCVVAHMLFNGYSLTVLWLSLQ